VFNIGVRAHDLGQFSIEDLADAVSAYGFRHIQLAIKKAIIGMDQVAGRLSPGLGNIYRDALQEKGINISVLGCYINPVHPDTEERHKALALFEEHLKYARSFGCSIVGTETGSPLADSSFTDMIYDEQTFEDFITSLKTMVTAAEKTGTIAAIEGVADKNCIYSHQRMKRTLDMIPSPNLGIIYDPVNFLPAARAADSDTLMQEAFELFADKMVAIHLKDYRMINGRKDGTLPAGQGELNTPLLFDLVKEYKPWIPILLENNTPASLKGSLDYINSLAGNRT